MKHFRILSVISLAVVMLIGGCQGDDPAFESSDLTLSFRSELQGGLLDLNSTTYQNNGEGTYTVEDFKFYISNLKLMNSETGAEEILENTYFLIHKDQNYENYQVEIKEVPKGSYDQIEFAIGIDPEANLSIDQTGDLDPNNQMAWNWNIGYKFMLLEGMYTDGDDQQKPLVFHIGADPNYRVIQLDLPESIKINNNRKPEIRFAVDVGQFFEGPNLIDFNAISTVKHAPEASELADNYASGMFEIMSISE